MRKRNYRAGVAAVLAGAALFSPLLCGMTCRGTREGETGAAVEAAPAAGEFVAEFVGSGVVGCALTHVVLEIDWSGWEGVLEDGAWVWVGFEAVRLVGGVFGEANELESRVRP
jgi:hypothetical protein